MKKSNGFVGPSNPIAGNSYEGKKFTYESDSNHKLFYVSASSTNWIPVSLLVFAMSEEDAKEKFFAALRFLINDRIDKKKHLQKSKGAHNEEFIETADTQIKRMQELILGTGELQIEINQIEPNQFFKVGWASNDTIF